MTEPVVHGARCVWWDFISKASKLPGGLPCCPYCQGVLFQMSESEWWSGVNKYEAEGHTGYSDFVKWWQGKCFKSFKDAKQAYKTNNLVLNLDVLRWIDE